MIPERYKNMSYKVLQRIPFPEPIYNTSMSLNVYSNEKINGVCTSNLPRNI